MALVFEEFNKTTLICKNLEVGDKFIVVGFGGISREITRFTTLTVNRILKRDIVCSRPDDSETRFQVAGKISNCYAVDSIEAESIKNDLKKKIRIFRILENLYRLRANDVSGDEVFLKGAEEFINRLKLKKESKSER